jgi:hypothetical protein
MEVYVSIPVERNLSMLTRVGCSLLIFVCSTTPSVAVSQTQFRQTQADDYTRYELLAPESQSFRIFYDVSATTAGARHYFNSLRAGSSHTVHGVNDQKTGRALEWRVVSGAEAHTAGHARANPNGEYLQVTLARPVPEGGEARVRIDKTYRDTASYFTEGDEIVFSRSLGIKRNSVVLPAGYELTGVNYPSQVIVEPNGRIKVSFLNRGPAGVPYEVKARLLPPAGASRAGSPRVAPEGGGAGSPSANRSVARVDYQFSERAFQDREIVYFLQQPETHSFRLYHDYTETRPGIDKYLNVVRAGSRASNPSAKILDTGEELLVETLRGNEILEKGIELGAQVTAETEVVVIWFDAVRDGESVRLRIEETYTDPNRYLLYGDELVWDRSFGRPSNTVLLPNGWYLRANSVPAVVDLSEDGRIRLHYVNDRPGNIDVFLKAKRR